MATIRTTLSSSRASRTTFALAISAMNTLATVLKPPVLKRISALIFVRTSRRKFPIKTPISARTPVILKHNGRVKPSVPLTTLSEVIFSDTLSARSKLAHTSSFSVRTIPRKTSELVRVISS